MKEIHTRSIAKAEALLRAVAASNPGFKAEFDGSELKYTTRTPGGRYGQELQQELKASLTVMKPGDVKQFKAPGIFHDLHGPKALTAFQQHLSITALGTLGPSAITTAKVGDHIEVMRL